METVSHVASAAAKAVWGENQENQSTTKEPVSGKQGDTSKGEPYDAGNMENPPVTPGEPGPTASKDSSAVPGDSSKLQNDVRDPSNPTTDPAHADAMKNVDDRGDGPNPADPDTAGPRPLDQVARDAGGDAGAMDKGAGAGKDEQAAGAASGAQNDGEDKGSGEKYVKSSGLNADGGDFDATQPGAGKEAERLMDQKGIDHNPGTLSKPGDKEGSGSPATKEKKSLGARIKAKLHKN